jgi:cystathionine beta-lyase/cystathionine gamma-synthase
MKNYAPKQVAWPGRSVPEIQKHRNGKEKGYYYSRTQDPDRDKVVEPFLISQGATGGFAVSSGMAGLNLVVNTLIEKSKQDKPISRPLVIYGIGIYYEGARRIEQLGSRYNFDCIVLETYDSSALRLKLEQISNPEHIAFMWIEPIENPRLGVSNISKIKDVLKSIAPQAKLVADNTALPCFQHSLKWGADIEVISLCKYPGQGVVNGGLVLTKDPELERLLYDECKSLGGILGSQDALEIINRMPNICLRLETHCRSAHIIAHLLKDHAAIETVFYPTLAGSCNGADENTVKKQMSGMGGGIVSFELKGGLTTGRQLMDLVAELQETIFIQSTFGMPTTHLEHFATFIPLSTVITPGLCRLSVGLLPPNEIWRTLKRLLDRLVVHDEYAGSARSLALPATVALNPDEIQRSIGA